MSYSYTTLVECSLMFFAAGFAAGFSASRWFVDLLHYRAVGRLNAVQRELTAFINSQPDKE